MKTSEMLSRLVENREWLWLPAQKLGPGLSLDQCLSLIDYLMFGDPEKQRTYQSYHDALAKMIPAGWLDFTELPLEPLAKARDEQGNLWAYQVPSTSIPNTWHQVHYDGQYLACDCQAGAMGGVLCCHVPLIALHLYMQGVVPLRLLLVPTDPSLKATRVKKGQDANVRE